MEKIRINVRGVDADTWEDLKNIRVEEQICLGRLVSDAINQFVDAYWREFDEMEEAEAGA